MTETTTAPEATGPVFVDEFAKATFEGLSKLINKRNALVGTANAANGDRLTLRDQITENSDDPAIIAARNQRDEAVLLLDKLVGPKVDAVLENAAESIAGIEAEIKELDAAAKPGLSYFKKVYGEATANFLPALAKIKGVRINSGGTGGRRVRGFNFAVTVGDETMEFENAASASKYLEVDTVVLQNAFFEAAGNPEKVKDAPDEVTFSLTFTETLEDGSTESGTAEIVAYRPDTEEVVSTQTVVEDDDDDDDALDFRGLTK